MIMYRCGGGGGGDINSFYIECEGNYYLPDGGMFRNGNATFNAPINIGDNVGSADYLCSSAMNFNSPVKMGNNLKSCVNTFYACRNYNQPTNIPDSVTNMLSMFWGCWNFNSPFHIPNNARDCSYMFQTCNKFNQPITIPNGVENCAYMFDRAPLFNQPVNIPDSVINCNYMFNSSAMASTVVIGEGVMKCGYMFSGVSSTPAFDVYVKGKTYRQIDVNRMFNGHSSSRRRNIHFNAVLNNIFNDQNALTGSRIYWSHDPTNNCFYYNNLYCYYNYEG